MTQTMLSRLKIRLGFTDSSKDATLAELLMVAEDMAKAYTGRETLPPGCESAVVSLAVIQYNRIGLEGEATRSEGGVSITIAAIPQDIRAMLSFYKLARTV